MTDVSDPYGYDELPYPSAPYPYTHPDHLATLATLFGMDPPHVEQCRVLEVGCADGANLIPLALTLPNSDFVGIDLSARQIASGQKLIRELGLTNVALHHEDLERWKTNHQFDFIIAHGFYSWTPRATRSALLRFCRRQLTSDGIVFISYNVLPGWQTRLAIRTWLLDSPTIRGGSHCQLSDVRRQLQQLATALGKTDEPQLQSLMREITQLLQWSDAYLRHDLLEVINEPVTFGTFVDDVEEHGLRFFAEADFASMVGVDLPECVARELPRLTQVSRQREQLIDVLTQRTFRQSLLCHAEKSPREQLGPDALRTMYVASTLTEADASQDDQNERRTFCSKSGFHIQVPDRVCVESLRELARRWPGGEFLKPLVAASRRKLQAAGCPMTVASEEEQVDALAAILLAAFAERSVELHVTAPPFTQSITERPQVSPLARIQAAHQSWVTSLRHDVVTLDEHQLWLVGQLDGTRSRADLLACCRTYLQPIASATQREVDESTWLDANLLRLARRSLLWPN